MTKKERFARGWFRYKFEAAIGGIGSGNRVDFVEIRLSGLCPGLESGRSIEASRLLPCSCIRWTDPALRLGNPDIVSKLDRCTRAPYYGVLRVASSREREGETVFVFVRRWVSIGFTGDKWKRGIGERGWKREFVRGRKEGRMEVKCKCGWNRERYLVLGVGRKFVRKLIDDFFDESWLIDLEINFLLVFVYCEGKWMVDGFFMIFKSKWLDSIFRTNKRFLKLEKNLEKLW